MNTRHGQIAFRNLAKRGVFGCTAVFVLLFAPTPYAFAESAASPAPATSASCTPVAATPGIDRPTGADAPTYLYNACTGLWENDYYTWSPATKTATPKTPYVYMCDTNGWHWTYQKWVYSPGVSAFRHVTLSVAQLPAGAAVAPGSLSVCAPPPAPVAPPSTSTALPAAATATTSTSADTVSSDVTTTVTVDNQITSTATTGNATATGNTTTGDAATGGANATANVINTVQSSSVLGSNVVAFTANIDGDVQGDLVVDPSQLQPATGGGTLESTDIAVNASTSGTINNSITLNATTGNATLAGNTTAGNATSGSASAVADVINVLDSIVNAGQSFVGVININGNLHGNILVPQNFLDELLATNVPSTTMSLSAADTTSLGISNNVTSSASTGNAVVAGNTTAGHAVTGSASTTVTIFNLTGNDIVGSNCLLVFVNVSGKWIGVIMNAPAGTTAAALGDGITENAPGSTTAATVTTNDAINNTINLAAASGNATVRDNTTAGNATTGNADTAVNLLNLNNTQLNLSGWFGVLFINVFGNWFGNFGVYTPPAPQTSAGAGADPKPSADSTPGIPDSGKVFRFLETAHAASVPAATPAADPSLAVVSAQLASKAGQTLGASIGKIGTHVPAAVTVPVADRQLQAIGGIMMALGLAAIAAERFLTIRSQRRLQI